MDVHFFQPCRKLFIGQHGIYNAVGVIGFILLGDARADKNTLRVWNTPLDILTVRLHRCYHIGKVRKLLRKIFLNQQIYGMAAGGDQNVTVFFAENPLIFRFYLRCAERRFLRISKTELFQRIAYGIDADAVIIGNKRRGNTGVDRIARLKQNLDLFHL